MVLQGFEGSATSQETSPWSFAVSSFLVLLGEGEEAKYRYMRRSWLECLALTPVAGLQSYLKAPHSLVDVTGREYSSPHGGKKAALRNMMFHYTLETRDLLADGHYAVYRIPPHADQLAAPSSPRQDLPVILVSLFHLVATAALLWFLFWHEATSWIGIAGCLVLLVHAVFLRVSEKLYSQLADLRTRDPDGIDAAFFLGRRNSCLVLEGSRRDVAAMTGQGVRLRDDACAAWLAHLTRVATFLVLVFVFAVIPNGTTWDQLAFIILNVLGQLNVLVGQRLNSRETMRRLELVEAQRDVPTRTHVYANLIRRFRNGSWVDEVNLLPHTDGWARWRARVDVEGQRDAQELLDECAREPVEAVAVAVEDGEAEAVGEAVGEAAGEAAGEVLEEVVEEEVAEEGAEEVAREVVEEIEEVFGEEVEEVFREEIEQVFGEGVEEVFREEVEQVFGEGVEEVFE